MRSQKTKQDSGGVEFKRSPFSLKKKLQAFEGQEIEGVEFGTILHSSLLQASKDNKRPRGEFRIILFSSLLQAFEGQEIEGVEFRTILHSSLPQLALSRLRKACV